MCADPAAGVPLALASAATLARPPTWRRFATGAVSNYALTTHGWHMILDAAAAAGHAHPSMRADQVGPIRD
jgi:hypothetical protein